MSGSRLVRTVVLATAFSTPVLWAAAPPALEISERQLADFASTRGPGDESARLAKFFDLYWLTRLRASPEWATYVGEKGFDDRLSDQSPATIALLRRIPPLELAALTSI